MRSLSGFPTKPARLGKRGGYLANVLVIGKCEKVKHVRVHYTVIPFIAKRTEHEKRFGTPWRPSQLNTNPVLGTTISTILRIDNQGPYLCTTFFY
jgi:hypothetical protein